MRPNTPHGPLLLNNTIYLQCVLMTHRHTHHHISHAWLLRPRCMLTSDWLNQSVVSQSVFVVHL